MKVRELRGEVLAWNLLGVSVACYVKGGLVVMNGSLEIKPNREKKAWLTLYMTLPALYQLAVPFRFSYTGVRPVLHVPTFPAAHLHTMVTLYPCLKLLHKAPGNSELYITFCQVRRQGLLHALICTHDAVSKCTAKR